MRFTSSVLLVLLVSVIAGGQGVPDTQEDRNKRNLESRMSNLGLSDKLARSEAAKARRNRILAKPVRAKMTDEFAERMKIDPLVSEEYNGFSSVPGQGITKLISPVDCGNQTDLKRLSECLQANADILEFANGFSFRESKRAVFARSDIALGGGFFVAGRHSVQAIIVNLGDVPLDSLNAESSGVKYLIDLKPATSEQSVDKEFALYKNGLTVASFSTGKEQRHTFGKISKIVVNQSYAIRSIAYRPPGLEPLDKDQDILTVFRVVGVDEDGAVTIVWRELTRGIGLEMIPESSANAANNKKN